MGLLDGLLLQGIIPAGKLLFGKRDPYPDGSPSYEWEPGALAASASIDMDPETQFPGARTYGPLDSIVCVNNDVVDIDMILNNKERYFVPAGVIQPVQGGIGIRAVRITNLDAGTAATAGQIVCRLRKLPKDINDLAREAY